MSAPRSGRTRDAFKQAAVQSRCEVCRWRPPKALRASPAAKGLLHAHHVVPVSCGGPDDHENLILVCPTCHAVAHAMGAIVPVADRKVWAGPLNKRELFWCFALLERPTDYAVLARIGHDVARYMAALYEEAERMNNPRRGLVVMRGGARRFA